MYTLETMGWHLQWHTEMVGTVSRSFWETCSSPRWVLILGTAFLISWITILLITWEGCQRVAGVGIFVVHRCQVCFLPPHKTTSKSYKSLKLHMTADLWTDGGYLRGDGWADRWTDRQDSAFELCSSSFTLLQGDRWSRMQPNPLRLLCYFSRQIKTVTTTETNLHLTSTAVACWSTGWRRDSSGCVLQRSPSICWVWFHSSLCNCSELHYKTQLFLAGP